MRNSKFEAGDYINKRLPMSPQKIFALNADWYLIANQSIGIGTNYVGTQYMSGDFTNVNSMPAYSVTNINYRLKQGDLNFSFSIRNIFDKSYYPYGTLSSVVVGVYPDQGRSYFGTMAYKF